MQYHFDVNGQIDDIGMILGHLSEARAEARRLLALYFEDAALEEGEYRSWSCILRVGETNVCRIVLASLVEDLIDPTENHLRLFRPD